MAIKPVQLKIGFDSDSEQQSSLQYPFDTTLFLCALTLLVFGFVMMTSASISISERAFAYPFHYSERQLLFILIGLIVGYAVWRTPVSIWNSARIILLILGFILLALVLVPKVGQTVNGSTRWIRFGSFNMQISEIIKLFIIVFLAGYLSKHIERLKASSIAIIMPVVILFGVTGLLILQPDLGAGVVIFATGISMFLLARVRLKVIITLFLLIGSALTYLIVEESYRLQRIMSFLDPWKYANDEGYQLVQSLIAFARGEWFGVGLGESMQKLSYLPEAHTDFLLAIIAEELGVISILTIIIIYCGIAWRAMKIGKHAQLKNENFSAFLAYGIGSWITFQAFVNIAVNMGALPTKGLTLPLMSYGGSSMVMTMVAIALLLRVDYELRIKDRQFENEECD